MDKQQTIAFIESQLATNKISREDLANIVIKGAPAKEETSKNMIRILYGIGAIIAVVGVCILIAQNWEDIGFAGRILSTLGISVVTYIAGFVMRNPERRVISQVMFAISATLAPLGSYVLLNQAHIDFSSSTQLATSLILLVVFGTALLITKRNNLVIISVGLASWAYYAAIVKVFEQLNYDNADLFKWATMLLGASFILIGLGYRTLWKSEEYHDNWEKIFVQNFLYKLGTLAILGAGISIGGFFDILFIALIFAAFYGSIYLKNRSVLILGAIFLVIHIIKLTSKYFVDSVGWPVSLICIGFLIIGIGYMTFYLNKKFIKPTL